MAAPIVVPFNNNPAGVSVKTASYTIPAGKYAQVYVECDSGGIFTLNAVSAVVTAAFLSVDQLATSTTTYTTPAGYMSIVSAYGGAAGSFNINSNGFNTTAATTYTNSYNLGPAGTMLINGGAGATAAVQGVAMPSNASNRQATFWIPTGTVISGSGNWKAVVQEFNIIS